MQTSSNAMGNLPAPIKAYFAADSANANTVAQCFGEGAVVIDEQREPEARAGYCGTGAQPSSWATPMRSPSGPRM
jgi:hypothetical protein